MLRVRFHGRGGQGIKTAGRILGSALFLAGYEVQDAPRYGAERRGAPMFAYVRASKNVIYERGIITRPDLVLVADDSLLALQVAGVAAGLSSNSLLLIHSTHSLEELQEKLAIPCPVLLLPPPPAAQLSTLHPPAGNRCAAAAAQLLGLEWKNLEQAMQMELSGLDPELFAENIRSARDAFRETAANGYQIVEKGGPDLSLSGPPHWIELPFEDASISAPAIHGTATSLQMDTGSWRTLRPVIDNGRCSRCGLCHTYCPDGAIGFDAEGYPDIDYGHCKGCMICLVQCPLHAIAAIPEEDRQCANS